MSDMTPGQRDEWGSPRRGGESASWVAGLVLIGVGAVFLLERFGMLVLSGNWWAIFIYLAAVGSYANAWRAYRARGDFGPAAGTSLVWGLVLTVVASILLFDLSWDRWWPAILIAIGTGMIVSNALGNSTRRPKNPAA